MHQISFDQLGLIEPIRQALQQEGYTTPTPIQAEAIPYLLEGRDLLGCAQTGTGKTAAFAIPILQLLYTTPRVGGGKRPIQALILTPTRELAIQIDESFRNYGRHTGLKHAVIFGGVGQKPQTDALRSGIDVLVATPGRLLDLMGQGHVDLTKLRFFVLDEADRMLDMGFIHDVKRIITKIPQKRQTLLFSATMPQEIQRLVHTLLHNPVKVEVTPVSSTAETIEQSLYYVDKGDKPNLLVELLKGPAIREVLVFTRTKHGANKLTKHLEKAGISAEAIHGNKSQNARQAALKGFKDGRIRVLVATDIAARGIDIDSLAYVVNFDIPNIPETYVHRIGRTGRAGASGRAVSFCDHEERLFLRDIQKLISRTIPVVEDHPYAGRVSSRPEPRPHQQSHDYRKLTQELIGTDGRGEAQPVRPANGRPHHNGPRPQGQQHSQRPRQSGQGQGNGGGSREGGGQQGGGTGRSGGNSGRRRRY